MADFMAVFVEKGKFVKKKKNVLHLYFSLYVICHN